MKKVFLFALLLGSFKLNAQLLTNSIAQNFTITAHQPLLSNEGMNNNGTYTLYDYLDQGYTVFLDFSTTWCAPCWDFHQAGVFDSLYSKHGPTGYPGVDANTTNDVMVFWLEVDSTTADSSLAGQGNMFVTAGNWLEPTPGHPIKFPMVNLTGNQFTQILSDYNVTYFPIIYKICPNRKVTEMGLIPDVELYDSASNCFVASNPVDLTIDSYNSLNEYCPGSDYTPVITIQNYGTQPLTNATVTVTLNGTTVSTGNYSGSLDTYDFATVTCSSIANPSAGVLSVNISSSGDADLSNNTFSTIIQPSSSITNSVNATVKMITDYGAAELSWKVKNSSGIVVASAGPYGQGTSASTPQPDVNFTLEADECYSVHLHDARGDGFDGFSGNGSFKLQVDGTDVVVIDEWNGTPDTLRAFRTSANAGINTNDLLSNSIQVYPNPASDIVTVEFDEIKDVYSITLFDITGRELKDKKVQSIEGINQITLSTSDLKAGNYFISIASSSGIFSKIIQIR